MNYIIFEGRGSSGPPDCRQECVRRGIRSTIWIPSCPAKRASYRASWRKNEGVEYIRRGCPSAPHAGLYTDSRGRDSSTLRRSTARPATRTRPIFETNILGAEHVTAFAERYGIRKIPVHQLHRPPRRGGGAEDRGNDPHAQYAPTASAQAGGGKDPPGRQRIRRGSSPSSAPASFTARASTAT